MKGQMVLQDRKENLVKRDLVGWRASGLTDPLDPQGQEDFLESWGKSDLLVPWEYEGPRGQMGLLDLGEQQECRAVLSCAPTPVPLEPLGILDCLA